MNHILEAADFPGEMHELGASASKPAAARLPWENYVRCLLLTAIIGMVGYMAWRPSMLRLSALRALMSPSHGDSLAWKPSEEATQLIPPVIRTPSPTEWRLSATHGAGVWQTRRPGAERFSLWRGARMSRPQWKRFSANPWNWQNDAAFGSRRKPELSELPAQKPASSFRSKDADTWEGTGTAQARETREAPVTIPEAIASPALATQPPVDRNTFDGLPSLEIPSLPSTESVQSQQIVSIQDSTGEPVNNTPDTDMAKSVTVQPAERADTTESPASPSGETERRDARAADAAVETPISAVKATGETETPVTPQSETENRATDSEKADTPPSSPALAKEETAEPIVTPAQEVVEAAAPMDSAEAEPGAVLTIELPDEIAPDTRANNSLEPEIASVRVAAGDLAATTSMRPREATASSPQTHVASPDQSQPSSLRTQPAATEQTPPEKTPLPSRENPEKIDWTTTEITEAIPGAYLTIYPKLRFIGLCVPGQNYIRKYNQVAVPRELTGPKMNSMDGRTPYGKYYIAGHRRDAAGARLILSWPSPDDARRVGLSADAVTEIENAWLKQAMPPQSTAAGGGVYLTGMRSLVETTDGSFALEEPHLEEIYTALQDGAWVFVQE